MNANQAKEIPIIDVLAKLLHFPVKIVRQDAWYISPFRDEKTASFKVNVNRNIWYDHGEGIGGNILDFVMRFNRTDVRGALQFLEKVAGAKFASSVPTVNQTIERKTGTESQAEIIEVKKLFSFPLKNYLIEERGIPLELGFRYLKEIRYTLEGKEYFALGFKNRSGGYELRNPGFKGCIGRKDITIIDAPGEKVLCFEGHMNFLSYLTLIKCQVPPGPVVVLNSTSFKSQGLEEIKKLGRSSADTFFDNDHAGQKVYDFFQENSGSLIIRDGREFYRGYNDLNKYLKANHTQQATVKQ